MYKSKVEVQFNSEQDRMDSKTSILNKLNEILNEDIGEKYIITKFPENILMITMEASMHAITTMVGYLQEKFMVNGVSIVKAE